MTLHEDRLRSALAAEAEDVTPGPLPHEAVLRRGRARRVRRRTQMAASLAVAALVPVGVGSVVWTGQGGPTSRVHAAPGASRQDASASASAYASASAPASGPASSPSHPPSLTVVTPGQKVRFGPTWVKLTARPAGTCVSETVHPAPDCRHVIDPNTGTDPGVIGTQQLRSRHGTLVSGLYRGQGEPVGAVVRWTDVDGHGHSARGGILSLAGHPGWAVYVVDVIDDSTMWPDVAGTHIDYPMTRVTLYDADGNVVASPTS